MSNTSLRPGQGIGASFVKKKSKGLQYEKLFCLQSVGYSY